MKNLRLTIATYIVYLCASLFTGNVSAQTFLFEGLPQDNPQFGLRYLRPFFEGDDDLTLLSGVYDLSVNVPVSMGMNLVGSIPYSTFDSKSGSGESDIGDIYIGLARRRRNGDASSVLSIGLFLPTAPSDESSANFSGLFTNFYQLHKYLPDVLTLYGNYTFHRSEVNGAITGLELGPTILFPTGNNNGDTELFLHYGGTVGYRSEQLAVLAEVTGIAIVSEDVEDFSDRFEYMAAFGGQWMAGSFRPGVFYKIYFKDDLKDIIDGVLGLKMDINLK